MPITLGELKQAGQQALAAGDLSTALKIYWRLTDADPHDISTRLKIADLVSQAGATEAAVQLYQAVGSFGVRSGHPLLTLVITKVLEGKGADPEPLLQELAKYYCADSNMISKFGQRISAEHPDTKTKAPDLQKEISPQTLVMGAAAAAANMDNIGQYPEKLHMLPLLSDLSPETFVRLCMAMKALRLPHGEMVIREGEIGNSFFLMASGQVRVYRTDTQGVQTELARLGEGALFGEMAIIHASPRTASVQVMGEADLLEIDRNGLSALAKELHRVAQALDRFTRERLLNNLLATSPLFTPFSRQQRLELIKRFTGHEVAADTVVINEGDEGRGLYVVLSGEVEVTKDHAGEQILLATLKAGDVFGEISLIKGYPATATVRAMRRSTILFLDRVYFTRLTEALPEIKAFFANLSEERLHDTQTVLADEIIIESADERVLI